MDELLEMKQRLREQRPASWENLPDIPLYMDQVLALMNRQTIQFNGEDSLTAAMVNNYIKDGVAPRAEGKRYNATHLAYLTMICVLKQVLPVRDVALLINREMSAQSVEENYDRFCAELSSALNSAADLLPEDLSEADLVSTAMNYALLSYAYGLAGRRMTELLREDNEAPQDAGEHRGRRRHKKKDGETKGEE